MAYIRTCVQNLGEIRRPVRNNCPSSLIIDRYHLDPLVHLLDEIFDGSHHLCRRVRLLCAETRYQDVNVVEGENVVVNVRPTNLVDVIPSISNVDTWRGIVVSELNYFTHRMRTVLYCNVIMGG